MHAGFLPWRSFVNIAVGLVLHQSLVSAQNSSIASIVSSTTTTKRKTSTTTTTTEPNWPECPEWGCKPCPAHSTGRPYCACLDGYTLTGKPSDADQQIPWDETRGWIGRCLPVACDVPPVIPHAKRADDVHVEDALVFPEQARYLCDPGYKAAGRDSEVLLALGRVPNSTDNSDRILVSECTANGTLSSATLLLCVPTCGDGRLMPTDHLPMYDKREQCDDGNRVNGDGCSSACALEPGFICSGGSPTSVDACRKCEVWADSVVVLGLTGHREPSKEEIGDATIVALKEAVGCPGRDLEILSVTIAGSEADGEEEGSTTSQPETTTTPQGSRFHAFQTAVLISFRVKISDPERLSINNAAGTLRTPQLMKPKMWVAYAERTSLKDLYVRIIDVSEPSIQGDLEAGIPTQFSLSGEIKKYSIMLSPVYSYLILISLIAPFFVWFLRIRRRSYRLMGRFNDIDPAFKGNWAFNICTCLESKCLFVSLICCLPARLADTWDSVGFLPYWAGVRRAVCCCVLYLIPCFGLCGAFIPAHYRSEMRDFFGFGDEKSGNTEFADYCCYVICPLCCVVQEARHVDTALAVLPPPIDQQVAEYQFDIHNIEAEPKDSEDQA